MYCVRKELRKKKERFILNQRMSTTAQEQKENDSLQEQNQSCIHFPRRELLRYA